MDNFLEEIRQREQAGVIKTTHEFIGSGRINPTTDISFKTFKPAIYFKLLVLCFAIGLFALAVFKTFQNKSLTNSETGGVIVAYLASIIIGINAIRQFLVDKAMNFKIRVDNSGISIDNTLYKWADIYETAIMKKFAGRSTYKYLVIGLKDKSTYKCYDLTNFVNLKPFGFSMVLAKYIEYFKPSIH
jgi:hypothetical protein